MEFTINVCPRTKKNSQRIITNPKTHKPMIVPSKAYKDYEKACKGKVPKLNINYQVNIEAIFYMKTRRKVDLVNLQEALLDVLVKYKCITDDNSNIVVSMDGSRVSYDKNCPRTVVRIERIEEWKEY